jgi:hypothetical protein
VLRDIVENKETKRVHVSRLKKFIFDPARVVPLDVARRDKQELIIEWILSHRGLKPKGYTSVNDFQLLLSHRGLKPKGYTSVNDFQLLVHWMGSEDSWEPIRGIRLVPAVHSYLRRHGLERWIPKDFR